MEMLKEDLIQAMKFGLAGNTFYMLVAEQRLFDHTQTFYLGFDAGKPHLYRDYHRAAVLHNQTQDFAFLGNQLIKAIEERTREDDVNPGPGRDFAYYRGEWKFSFVPVELNYALAVSGFMVGNEKDASDFTTETSDTINIKPRKPANTTSVDAPTPDGMDDYIAVTADELILAIRTKEWQFVEKIKGTDQHSIRQRKDQLVYSYSFRGVFAPNEFTLFYDEFMAKGWSGVEVTRKGSSSCSWTIVELYRAVNV